MTHDSSPIEWSDPQRRQAFEAWLREVAPRHGLDPHTLRAASSDASFRRYFRVWAGDAESSFIVMDAPPTLEDVRAFVDVAERLDAAGLNAPRVLEQDLHHGFLLLTDLGSALYLQALQDAVERGDEARRDALVADATRALVRLQGRVDARTLPAYDETLLRRELDLFPHWCVGVDLGVSWDAAAHKVWEQACAALVRSALEQPTVAVHRDYMPRNLMVCAGKDPQRLMSPGILDFQDAVRGPLTYDIASLLRDAFISWPQALELDWAVRYWELGRRSGLPLPGDFGEFWRQLEWMGLQRHLKVLGIFCRLKHRDAKPHYSQDLPRFFEYAHQVATRYNELRPLSRLLEPLMGAQRIDAYH